MSGETNLHKNRTFQVEERQLHEQLALLQR
jgi:hypothetical protein